MSIIDEFALRHTQLSAVHADIHKQVSAEQAITRLEAIGVRAPRRVLALLCPGAQFISP